MKPVHKPMTIESAESLLRPEYNISGLTSGIVLIIGGLWSGKKRLARGIAKRTGYIHAGELRDWIDWERVIDEMADSVPVVATLHAFDIPAAIEKIEEIPDFDGETRRMIRSIVACPECEQHKVLSVLINPFGEYNALSS